MLSSYLKHVWSNITIELVVAMYCLIIALIGIPGEELYLKKDCNVNLNHSMEVCDNIFDHKAAQIETQKLVSTVQPASTDPLSSHTVRCCRVSQGSYSQCLLDQSLTRMEGNL